MLLGTETGHSMGDGAPVDLSSLGPGAGWSLNSQTCKKGV